MAYGLHELNIYKTIAMRINTLAVIIIYIKNYMDNKKNKPKKILKKEGI